MLIAFVILILLLAFSASFSSFETALFSLSPWQRYRLTQAGGASSLISKVLTKPRELLTTALLGNELVNVAIAILAGGIAYDLLQGYWVRTVYLVSTAVTTLVLLIFGEIVPKNIAVRSPLIVAQLLIVPYQIFAWLVFPFRVIFTKIAEAIVSLFGADPKKGRRLIVEEELRSLLEQGQQEGTLADLERRLIQNALDFSSLQVSQVMTSRQKIFAAPAEAPIPEILKMLQEHRYSRVPVYDQNLNQVVGILHAKEILPYRLKPANSEWPSLREILKPYAHVSPETMLDELFQEFQRRRVHMGIVRDGNGNVIGLVTMDDLLRRFFT